MEQPRILAQEKQLYSQIHRKTLMHRAQRHNEEQANAQGSLTQCILTQDTRRLSHPFL